jgi:hypothetical protein
MIDMSAYDFNKVKEIDKILFLDAERMNEIEWSEHQPFWRKLLFCEKPMPKRFRVGRVER